MKHLFKENAIRIAIVAVFILIFTGAALSYYNRYTMSNALTIKKRTEAVLTEIDRIHDNIRFMDISARGYALIRKRNFLFWKVSNAQAFNKEIFTKLDSLFEMQGLINPNYEQMKRVLHEYTNVFAEMVDHLEHGQDKDYLVMLEHDYGKSFYQTFTPFLDEIIAFENGQAQEAQTQYEAAVNRNRIVQILLFIMGLPTMSWLFFKLRRDERERKRLLLNLESNNKQYLFDNGAESEKDAKRILQTSINNLQQASKFVGEISNGNYDVTWNGLVDENKSLNKNNLVGRLVMMRDEMKRIKEEDRKRIWTTTGLSELSEIIRKYQHNLKDLTWEALTFIVKYTGSQQGGLFILKHHHENGYYLELSACYAFERRKIVEKEIKIGDGLIGQAFLEGEPILLKKVPDQYLNITSGLGYANPDCLVIVPMKHNDKVHALIELATFSEYQPYEVAFLEKAGSFIASAVFAAEQNEHNKSIMEKMQSQTEQLRAQEEELRQNIEELEATQENLRRKHVEENVGVSG